MAFGGLFFRQTTRMFVIAWAMLPPLAPPARFGFSIRQIGRINGRRRPEAAGGRVVKVAFRSSGRLLDPVFNSAVSPAGGWLPAGHFCRNCSGNRETRPGSRSGYRP